jgi:hypothetical protein
MRIATGPPGGLRRGVGFTPTSPGGLCSNSLRNYTPPWKKSNRLSGLVSVNLCVICLQLGLVTMELRCTEPV